MKKISLFILIIMTTIIFTGCGCSKSEKKEVKKDKTETAVKKEKKEKKVNFEDDIVKDQEFDGFKTNNTSLIYDGKATTFRTEITNISGQPQSVRYFNIVVKDKYNRELLTMHGVISGVVGVDETKIITSSTDINITTEATTLEYSVVK